MVKKPKGVEALVTAEPPPSIQDITLRDWFAAFAMQALIQKPDEFHPELAYIYADQMLFERKK